MAKKTPEEKWKWIGKIFNPNLCTISFSSLVADGFFRPIKGFDRQMFEPGTQEDDGTPETQTIPGEIISQNGPMLQVKIEGGEIIGIELA